MGVQLIHSVVLVSGVQHSESGRYTWTRVCSLRFSPTRVITGHSVSCALQQVLVDDLFYT